MDGTRQDRIGACWRSLLGGSVSLCLRILLAASTLALLAHSGEGRAQWSTKASMPTARMAFAVAAANGIIHTIGGESANDCTFTALVESYDPSTNSWSIGAAMPTRRTNVTAGTVNGIVYVIGGHTGCGATTGAVEAYNPATNTWSTKASLSAPRATVGIGVVNGVLYAVGGGDSSNNPVATVQAYDPGTNTWTTRAPMPTARAQVLVGVVNGILYAIGGMDALQAVTTVEAYDPVLNTWSTKASMPTARTFGFGGAVSGGKVYVAGGFGNSGVLATVEAYDPAANTWSTASAMPTARGNLRAEVVNGVIHALGGISGSYLATNEALSPGGPAPPTAPGAPTIGLATAGNAQATVNFTAPASDGGSAITGYTATSAPGGITKTGMSSPLVVTGLSNGTSYTFTVTATNGVGTGSASAASNAVTPRAPLTSPSPSAAIAAGGDHSIALRVDGAVRDWGADSFGELGTGRLVFASSAQPIPGVPSMMAVSAGDLHSAAVASDGTVWTWGRNSEGQLGNGSTNDQTIPAQVAGLTGFVAIAAGYRHTLALRSDGTVWAWGANAFGQLGDNTTSQRARPVQIPGLSGVTAIAAGHEHSIAIRSGGNVWGWGRNQYGQLCNGSYSDSQAPVQASGLTGVTAVSTSLDHTMVLKGDATVWACGNGGYGVLGNGNPSPSANPVQATGLSGMIAVSAGQVHSMALRNDGTVWTWGNNTFGELGDASTTDRPTPVPVSGLTGVIAIAAGNGFSLALKGDGTVRAWGYDTYGQLGDGATANASTPVAVLGLTGATSIAGGGGHALVGKSDGTLRTWGYNGYGQLGLGGTTSRSTPTLPSGLSGIVAIAAGRFHTLALKDDGTVRGWGDNENGQLGDGTRVLRSAPVAVTGLTGIVAIAGGERFSLALKSDGTVWAWGNNQSGQLGNGTTSGFPGRADAQAVSGLSGVIAIAAGDNHAAAVKGDGTVWTWGYNGYGQLGDGSGTDRSAPVQVSGLSGVTMVSAGMNYTIARKGDGTAWAWGWNGFGQLGDGTTFNRSTPVPVSGLSGVVAVAAGGNVDTAYTVHTAALKSDGTVWTWGSNSSGQLGDGSTTSRSVPGPVSGLTGMTAVAVGHAHTLALKGDGTVLSWGAALGQNGSGQLGDGAFVARSRPVVVVAENGAGNLDANNWYLDLAPAISKSIPAALTPKVLAVAQFSDAGTLTATVKYKISELGTSVNNYVLALVPPSFLHPPSTASPDVEAKAGGLILAQLTPQGWTAVVGPLDAHSQGTATGAGGAANILSGVPLSSLPAGTKFCIGYGTSALAMLSAQSLKEVFAVGVADASATPCVLFGLYIEGPAASTSGATVTFKASVVGASPTGTVQFKDGSTGLSAPVVVVAANPAVSTASIATSSLSVGVHSIGAAYSGDAQNSAANVSPLQHTVSAGSASSVQLSGPASSQAGNEVAFSVTVVGNNPTGSVQFKDWGGDLGPVATLVGGETTLRISTLAAGSHSITAVYFGDGNNAGSTSNSVTHTVYATAVTQVTLSSSANPSTANVQVTLTAAVTGASPTGSIVFRDAGASLGIVPLSTGKASLVIAFAAPGVHALTAEYSGDLNNQGATSATLFQQVVAPVTKLASSTQLSSSSNPSTLAQSVAFSATVSGSAATPAGSVAFRDGAALIPGCAAVTLTAGVGACNTSVLGTGPHSVTATYSGNATYEGSTSLALTQSVNAGASLLSANPAALDFGGQSINTTSPALTTTITNVTGGSITVAALTLPSGFTLSSNTCGTVAAGGSCVIGLTFTPTLEGSTAGILGIVYAGGGPTGVSLAGIGERSLVTHYYRSILRRAPDAPGKAFWESEAVRLQSIGANVNEAWFAMASFFYFSGEYASFNRDNIGFVTDLYNTFFNRTPDGGGLSFWSGLMTSGMPREVVLASFEFSSEFAAFTQAIFGNTAARAEVDVVGDFYRGLLARLPDQGGFDFWVQKFRTAQCTGGGGAAGAVYTQVESISSSFANSGEYAGKNRTNSQYVGDLYNSFLRRGGDLNGVQFWINQLNTAAMTREQVRQQFIASSEFQGRVTNVINQGCIN